MNKDANTIERIRDLMKKKKWTKYKLAKEASVPQSTITSLFSGKVKNPSIETVSKISSALGVTADFLLDEGNQNLINAMPIEVDLADSEILNKCIIKIDGCEISKKELEKILALIRIDRQFK